MSLPVNLIVKCGIIAVELASGLFWNINGISCGKELVGQRNRGFYGTVIRYRDVGWVGTGHLENGIGETIHSLTFMRDGKPFVPASGTVDCRNFQMHKRATLHKAELNYTLDISDSSIRERVTLRFTEKSDIRTLYNFMHCWDNDFDFYSVRSRSGTIASGRMPTAESGKMSTFSAPYRAAFISDRRQIGVLSTLDTPAPAPACWLFWNRGKQDRKMYFRAIENRIIPAGTTFTWSMTTTFFDNNSPLWKEYYK